MREWPTIVSDAPSQPLTNGAPGFDAASLTRAVHGRVVIPGRSPIRGGSVDSRRITAGSCFFALPGERTDGHRFLAEAIAAGAAALVVREDRMLDADAARVANEAGGRTSVIAVPDVLLALQAAAVAWRDRFDPLVVGVTGSLAKTSTKEQIAEVLAERWSVLRNEGNENNEIGLPLTLLRLLPEHHAAVLEMGMYVEGDIALLARLARPSIGVVTAVRGTHLSRAGSIEAVARGKGELIDALPAGGTAILNADDERVLAMRDRTTARVLTYGLTGRPDVTADGVESLAEAGMRFTLRTPSGSIAVETAALGRHSVHNALAAAAVGLTAGFDLPTIASGLRGGFHAPHRTALVRAGEWRILDDSYNAAPDSMIAALGLLASLPGRRIAVLGEMLELGDAAEAAHIEVGRDAGRLADRLVVVGEGAIGIAQGAREAGMMPEAVSVVADRDAALELLLRILRPQDAILVKASRGIALELLVDALVAAGGDPVRA